MKSVKRKGGEREERRGGEVGRVEGRNDYGGPLCDVHFPRKLSQFRYRQQSQNEMHSIIVLATYLN